MDIEQAIRAHLATNTSVASLVGSRIYPLRLPEGYALPALVYQVVASTEDAAHDAPAGIVSVRLQLDAWGSRYGDVKAVRAAVRQALLGHCGAMGGLAYVAVPAVELELDLFEEETGLYRASMEYRVWYRVA